MRNMVIREKLGVAPIEDKMRKTRLRWFGHIKGRSIDAPVMRCEMINLIHCRRGQVRLKTSWNEVTRGILNFIGLMEDMAKDRSLWT